MPCREEEIHHAEEEGIELKLLRNPVELIGDESGTVKAMKCIEMELGEPDASGRRRPVPIEGSEFVLETDLAIMSIGAGANPLLTSTLPELELNKWSYIVADDKGRTSLRSVWAGGDIVTGAATVIEAMGAGRIVASDIHKWLSGEDTDWKAIPSPETEEKS
jgi:glutamate synthase (NADPH/NADH) small chain